MIKPKEKVEHGRDELQESAGSQEVAGEETRDSPTEPGAQGMWRWSDCLLLPTAQERWGRQ